jgi:pyruvate formate lyase activating enzyme
MRSSRNGQLWVPFGYVAGLNCDPIEKKPFFHLCPGSTALTFGMLGCNFHCAHCQNWFSSQALRDEAATASLQTITVDEIIAIAKKRRARSVISSYNEPLITAEWAAAIFEKARAAGLLCAMVSNGHATVEAIDFLQPWVSAFKVDLKCFDEERYRVLGGKLASVKETIRMLRERRIWTEVVTLLIPGFNDGENELRSLVRFLVSVDRDIPWHVTAFHPDYHYTDARPTTAADLLRAVEIGVAEGLRFVYTGNLTGRAGEWENTRCPGCRATLVKRYGFSVSGCRINDEGKCPECRTPIPGIWK